MSSKTKKQLLYQLNAILAILLALSLIIGETIRRYGDWGHWSRWMDDYLMGAFLIVGAVMLLKKKTFGKSLLLAAWGFNAGLLYGSFFSKLVDQQQSYQTNIAPGLLIVFIGLAFFAAIFGMVMLLYLEYKK